ncbi:hypothetical protein [Paracoccus aminovorans]|uniref:hypothetical protein n=1 Tax=Paracoccus aminovorans TaxID=34004 RepID=UPI000943815A|nr:hypothetical protein [Paracoccus aminovorans]
MSPAYADELVLITDADLNDAEVRNAELLHIARHTVDPEARKVVGGILVKLKGEQTFASILAESGLADRGWANSDLCDPRGRSHLYPVSGASMRQGYDDAL